MKLSIKALALTAAILWSITLLIVGAANVMFPGYGSSFLELMGSIYPGYQPGMGYSSVLIGAMYGFLDAAVGAAIFAWLYNCFAK